MSTIDFAVQSVQAGIAASVVGNLGAPLRTDDGEDEEELHFSSDPFSFGLEPNSEACDGGELIDEPQASSCHEEMKDV